MKIKSILFGFAVLAFLASCGDDAGSDITQVDDKEPIVEKDKSKQVFYQVPTPNEMFELIRRISDKKSSTELLNKPENVSNYIDSKQKALNFGIYSADLAYLSSFEIDTDALKYFNVINRLADELRISSAFEKDFFDRIQQNIASGDSLMSLSNETYFNAYAYLEENDRGATLALVVAGGWLEGIYLATNLVTDFDAQADVVERIVEQQLTLDNLLGFLDKYADDSDVGSVIAELEPLKDAFYAIDLSKKGSSTTMEKKGGKMVLGGSKPKLEISKEGFERISTEARNLRNKYVGVTI
jgi:hypothetical protein